MTIRIQAAAAIGVTVVALLGACGASAPEAMVASAKQYLDKNDKKAAVIQLKNALQKNPNIAEARFLLGVTFLDMGDLLAAEKELRKALELKHPGEEVVPPLARTLLLLGQHKTLVDEFSKVEVRSPAGKAQLQAAIGQAELALGNVAGARAAFTAALAAQSDYVPAQYGQARIAAQSRDYAKALSIVDAALARAGSDHEGWQLKGDLHSAQGQSEPALVAYRKAVELKPDFLPSHAAIVSLSLQQKNIEDAAKQLESMKRIAPKHPQTLYLQALVTYRQKNFIDARAAMQELLRIAPDYVPGLVLAGAIELELKSYPVAETHLLKAVQRAPALLPARRMLITTYLRNGEGSRALEALKPALDRIDKEPEMLALAGEVYMVNGAPGEAAKYFEKAAALNPSDGRKRLTQAVSLVLKGDTETGLRELGEVAAADTGIRADLALISLHMRRREFDKALSAIAALEKKQPTSPTPHNLRGAALLATGNVAGARRSFERAVELSPTHFPAVANLARLDLAEKKPAAARQRYEAVLAKDPKHLAALLALAELSTRSGGSPSEVVGLITRAISAHPNEPLPRLALISYHVSTDAPKKAVVAAQEALAVLPRRPEILSAAAAAYRVAGDTNQALSTYKQLASLQPDSADPHLRMAEIYVVAKNSEQALASLRTALTITPDLLEAQRGIIALHLGSGRTKEALAVAHEVQKQRPKQAPGYLLEGDVHAVRKQWSEAATAYRKGLKQTDSTDLAARLHNALFTAGHSSQAQQFEGAWLKDHPKDDAFRMQLAQAALGRQDHAAAAQQYRKLLERQPNNWVVLNNLAWTSAQLKEPKALEYAEQANKLAPDNPAVMDTLGVLLMQKGDVTRGLELLRKASSLAPQSADIRLNLAKGLLKVEQKEAARKELDELAKMGENFSRHAEVAKLRQGI
jgi:putative PEP-CTERM system TPR-repeat lipoprotein